MQALQEKDLLELRLAEQQIYKQALKEKDERLVEVEAEVRYLRNLLNEALAVPKPQLAPVGAPAVRRSNAPVPRRWNAR